MVDRVLGFNPVVVAVPGDVAAGRDQPALVRVFVDDPAVVLDVGRGWNRALHRGQLGPPADPIEQPHLLQLRREGDVVDRLARGKQVERGAIDLAVVFPIEVFRVKELQHFGDRERIEKDRPDDRHLRVEVMRWYSPCGERQRGRHTGDGQRSCVTITLTWAATSRCSFSETWCSPSVLIGSFRSILCRSISTRCWALSAAAMSWLVIEPKALSSAPTFNRTTTVLLSISSATACASGHATMKVSTASMPRASMSRPPRTGTQAGKSSGLTITPSAARSTAFGAAGTRSSRSRQ